MTREITKLQSEYEERQEEIMEVALPAIRERVEKNAEKDKVDTKISISDLSDEIKLQTSFLQSYDFQEHITKEFENISYVRRKGLQIRNEPFLEELEQYEF